MELVRLTSASNGALVGKFLTEFRSALNGVLSRKGRSHRISIPRSHPRQERLALLDELEGHLVELSQLMYSHHIVQRLFRDAKGPEEQKRLAKVFRGHGVRLATHAIGAEVVQTALISLPTASAGLIKVRARAPQTPPPPPPPPSEMLPRKGNRV